MKTTEWVDDIQLGMSAGRRVVVQSVIGFDRDSNCCAKTVKELTTLLAIIDARFAIAIRPMPIDLCQLAIRDLARIDGNAWRMLGETVQVYVPKGPTPNHQPGLILILPLAAIMVEASRHRLWDHLQELQGAHSSIVCVLIEGDGGGQCRSAWDETAWRSWLVETRHAVPEAVVRLYLVGSTTNEGDLVTCRELAGLAAESILADIVLRDRNAPRFLAQSLNEPAVSVGALGMSGQLALADSVAQSLAMRTWQELIQETQLAPTAAIDLPPDLPAAPAQLLLRAFQHPMPFDAQGVLARGESAERADYDVPCLVGFDFRFTIDLAKASKTVSLDEIPSSLWRSRLTELDAVVSTERVEAIANRACEYLQALALADDQEIQNTLRRAFHTRLNPELVCNIRDGVLDRIGKQRGTTFFNGVQESVDNCLSRMDAEIEKVGCWRSGALATAAMLLIAGAIVWASNAWSTGAIRFWSSALSVTGVCAVATGAVGCWWRAKNHAIDARDDVLEQIQRRAQAILCRRILNELEQITARRADWVNSSTTVLVEAASAITRSAKQKLAALTVPASLVERPGPHMEHFDAVYRHAIRRGAGHRTLMGKFRERCADLAEELLDGLVKAEDAPQRLLEFLENEVAISLSNHLDIWRFFSHDGTADSFDERAFLAKVRKWSRPVLCGTGLATARRETMTVDTFWVCPEALVSRLCGDSKKVLMSMNDRIVALHRLTYCGEMEKGEFKISGQSGDQSELLMAADESA